MAFLQESFDKRRPSKWNSEGTADVRQPAFPLVFTLEFVLGLFDLGTFHLLEEKKIHSFAYANIADGSVIFLITQLLLHFHRFCGRFCDLLIAALLAHSSPELRRFL